MSIDVRPRSILQRKVLEALRDGPLTLPQLVNAIYEVQEDPGFTVSVNKACQSLEAKGWVAVTRESRRLADASVSLTSEAKEKLHA